MTLEEAGKRFAIGIEKLKGHEKDGLLSHQTQADGTFDYAESDFGNVGLIHALLKAGMDVPTLKSYLALSTGDAEEQKNKLRILRKARGRLLEEIHEKQQSLDQIDYIIGQTRKEQGGKGI